MTNAKPVKRKNDYSEIAERYRKGARIVDLAKEFGISRPGMYMQLKKAGITEFRDDRKQIPDVAEAIDMYNQGLTMTKIAEHCGCSIGAISLMLKKYNVPTRNKAILPDLESIDIPIPDIKKNQREAFKNFQKDFIKQLTDDRSASCLPLDNDEDDDTAEIAALLNSL